LPQSFVFDLFQSLADECAALYVGPDEDVPKGEQFNR